ncbi:hypothetical protein Pla175_09220 [Pirellulimonas nuda]|uniref:3-keto-alpha-glucoside-1,2-lyase/3-keto-2-hydroxy-glucal hydratase domain-containing protein n=1 Tax=Pirellulimonas nuda TaxID=2528009 RepID=A0A518D7V4_9BACT|nr:DUF1080 domain-containing protein [Pirellulimonas nuda]QDU87557.1 hypothetical protein Pla175_09220 [Pirellulimonas nuda]
MQPRTPAFDRCSCAPWACVFVLGLIGLGVDASAQTPSGWLIHDMDRPQPRVVQPAPLSLPTPAPADARVLFDGADLTEWRSEEGGPARWVIRDGYMESVPDSGKLISADGFGDIQLHLEWAAPAKPAGVGQARGNSGVFLMGEYEVQVLDSFQSETYPDGQAAAIYGQYPPLVNACLPPGEWQSYDILFRRPRFDHQGDLLQPARIDVIHNGVWVQIDRRLWGPTSWLQNFPYEPHAERLPLALQDHGNPVRYRNIWVRDLPEADTRGPSVIRPYVPVSLARLEALVGSYGVGDETPFEVSLKEGRLRLQAPGRVPLELMPADDNKFLLRYTDGHVLFYDDADRQGASLEFFLGGGQYRSHRAEAGAPE